MRLDQVMRPHRPPDDIPPTDPTQTADLENRADEIERGGGDRCDVAIEAMPGYVLGELAPDDRRWLLRHTESCGDCGRDLGEFSRLDCLLDDLEMNPAPVESEGISAPPGNRAAYATLPSPLGPLFVAVSGRGVCEIGFATHESEALFRTQLRGRGFTPERRQGPGDPVADQLGEYFAGTRRAFELPLDLSGVTPFARSVLAAAGEIPFGGLRTYGEIARLIGRPGASRAVGNALGGNPIPVIVPCHRVVAAHGGIGGYTGGIRIKEQLLSLEGATIV